MTHLDLGLNALVGLFERLFLAGMKFLLVDLVLHVSLGLDLILLCFQIIDLGFLLGLLFLLLLSHFALFGDAFFLLFLLGLDSILCTLVGVLLTDLLLNILLVGEFVDGFKIVARRIIIVAHRIEDALVGQKIIPVSKLDSLSGAFAQ